MWGKERRIGKRGRNSGRVSFGKIIGKNWNQRGRDAIRGCRPRFEQGLPHSGGANLLNSEAGVGGNRRLSLVSFKWSLSGLPAFPLIAHYNRINNTSREVTEGDAYYTETCERNSLAVLVVSILTAISFFLSLSGDFRFLVNFHPRCLYIFQQYVQLFVKLEFNYDSSVIEDDFVLISFVSC